MKEPPTDGVGGAVVGAMIMGVMNNGMSILGIGIAHIVWFNATRRSDGSSIGNSARMGSAGLAAIRMQAVDWRLI